MGWKIQAYYHLRQISRVIKIPCCILSALWHFFKKTTGRKNLTRVRLIQDIKRLNLCPIPCKQGLGTFWPMTWVYALGFPTLCNWLWVASHPRKIKTRHLYILEHFLCHGCFLVNPFEYAVLWCMSDEWRLMNYCVVWVNCNEWMGRESN